MPSTMRKSDGNKCSTHYESINEKNPQAQLKSVNIQIDNKSKSSGEIRREVQHLLEVAGNERAKARDHWIQVKVYSAKASLHATRAAVHAVEADKHQLEVERLRDESRRLTLKLCLKSRRRILIEIAMLKEELRHHIAEGERHVIEVQRQAAKVNHHMMIARKHEAEADHYIATSFQCQVEVQQEKPPPFPESQTAKSVRKDHRSEEENNQKSQTVKQQCSLRGQQKKAIIKERSVRLKRIHLFTWNLVFSFGNCCSIVQMKWRNSLEILPLESGDVFSQHSLDFFYNLGILHSAYPIVT